MNENIDIEHVLKRYRGAPSSRVKRSVLSRFIHTFDSRSSVGFWKRPIPLYVATAIVVIAVGLSFFAGRKMFQQELRPTVLYETVPEGDVITTQELKWEVARNDLL